MSSSTYKTVMYALLFGCGVMIGILVGLMAGNTAYEPVPSVPAGVSVEA